MGALGFGPELAAGRCTAPRPPGFDFAGTMPEGARLSRASPAMRIGADGRLVSEAADVARFDHDPATRALRGLLVEPAATNLVADSADFGAASWSRDANGAGSALPVVTVDAAAAPDGTISADRLDFTRGANFSRISTNMPMVVGQRYTFSIWLRAAAAGGPSVALRLSGIDGGTLTVDSAWRRFSLTFAADIAIIDAQMLLWSQLAGAPASASLFAWGAQVEAGTTASSAIATQGGSAGRAADRLTLDWTRFGLSDGEAAVRCLFDDGSDTVMTGSIADGAMTLPTPLARPWLRRVELA